MAGEADIAPLNLTGERRTTPDARRGASSLCTQRCASSSRASSARTGRPSRSPAGRSSAARRITPAGCHTRRSTRPCSSRRAARRSASCCCVCERPVPSAGPRSLRASMPARGRSVMRLDSRAPHPRPRTVRSPVTGRGTCLADGASKVSRASREAQTRGSVLLPAPGRGSPGCESPARRGIYGYARPIKPRVTATTPPGARLYACRRTNLLGRHPTR